MLSKLRRSSRPRNARCRALDFQLFARFRKDTSGAVLIYSAFILSIILGVTGLSVDVSYWYSLKRSTQAAADVAALTGRLTSNAVNVRFGS